MNGTQFDEFDENEHPFVGNFVSIKMTPTVGGPILNCLIMRQ